MGEESTHNTASKNKDDEQRRFILQIVQPGLAGLMDGTVSSLAPLFAVALATQNSKTVFLVGLATALGAGISRAFSEALSDDGKISGRGNPLMRGLVEGVMTFLGAIAHALPFLIPHFWTAFIAASVVVRIELVVIAYIRNKYMDTPFLRAAFQIIVGGIIVLTVGIRIGKS